MFRFAIKSLWKNKVFTTINIIGLALGLSVALAMGLSIVFIAGMDQFHENQNVYKLAHAEDSTTTRYSDASSALLAPAVMEAFPEVTDYCQLLWTNDIILGTPENHVKANGFYAEEGWFRMLSFPLIFGDPDHVLADRNSIVLSEKLSQKLFGEENPMGKTISMYSSSAMEPHVFNVSGVFANVPVNSSLQFEFIIPFAWYMSMNSWLQSWNQIGTRSYIQVAPGTNIEELNHKITRLTRSKDFHMKKTQVFRLVPLRKSNSFIYTLDGRPSVGFYIIIALAVVGLAILIISTINYINLSIATSLKRANEIATKKIHGATRKNLTYQFLTESCIVAGISFVLAFILMTYLLQILSSHDPISIKNFLNPTAFALIGGLFIFTVAATTWYPAMHISRFSPVAIRQKLSGSGAKLSFWRKFLVTLQFVVAIILVTTSVLLSRQVNFLLNTSLGMDRFGIVFFTKNMPIEQQRGAFTQELLKYPGIESVTFTSQLPFEIGSSTTSVNWEGKNPFHQQWYSIVNVGDNFASTMRIQMLDGNDLTDGIQHQVLVNKAAVDIMKMDNPVGKTISIFERERVITGIVDNFKQQVFNDPNTPLFLIHDPAQTDKVLVRFSENNQSVGLASLQDVFNQFSPDFILDYTFLDLEFNQRFAGNKNLGRVMSISGILAVIIACIGLLGLTVHTSERRVKELGIRKINGAGVLDLILLLSSQIMKRILIAAAVAFPTAYFINKSILENFPDRVSINAVPFIWSFLILIAMVFLIMGWHIVWVARRNPVEALRYE